MKHCWCETLLVSSLLGVVSHQDRVDNAALGHDTRPLFIQSDKPRDAEL